MATSDGLLLGRSADSPCPRASSRGETRRFRPMTSDVSALSGIVAKGHQAMLTFSPPPLKFRTAGFPQYGFKRVCPWRPSPAPQTYTPFKWKSGLHVLIPGIRPGHMSVLAPTHSPNGPWLPRGLCRPPGFSLTMAIYRALWVIHPPHFCGTDQSLA